MEKFPDNNENIEQIQDNQKVLGEKTLEAIGVDEQEMKTRLRQQFVDDSYGKDGRWNRFCSCHETVDSSWQEAMLYRLEYVAAEYGDRVEKYGASLADINILLQRAQPINDVELPGRLHEVNEGYVKFRHYLPAVLNRHFSKRVSEEHSKTVARMVRILAQELYYDDDPERGKDRLLSDEECGLVAEPFIASLNGDYKTLDDVDIDSGNRYHYYSGDYLMDGIFHSLRSSGEDYLKIKDIINKNTFTE